MNEWWINVFVEESAPSWLGWQWSKKVASIYIKTPPAYKRYIRNTLYEYDRKCFCLWLQPVVSIERGKSLVVTSEREGQPISFPDVIFRKENENVIRQINALGSGTLVISTHVEIPVRSFFFFLLLYNFLGRHDDVRFSLSTYKQRESLCFSSAQCASRQHYRSRVAKRYTLVADRLAPQKYI